MKKLIPIASCFLYLFLAIIVNPSIAQDSEIRVGDTIEFEFHLETVQAEVNEISRNGWFWVEVEFGGRMIRKLVPDHHAVKVSDGESNGDETAMPAAEMRTWTDVTGKFKIEAKMLSHKNGKVELEKKDGRVITLPSAQLCETDNEYLKQVELAESDDNPFAGGEMKSGSNNKNNDRSNRSRNSRSNKSSSSTVATKVDPDNNEKILSVDQWSVSPDAATSVEDSTKIIRVPKSGLKNPFHNRRSPPVFSIDKNFVAYANGNPFDKASEFVRVDLAKQSSENFDLGVKEGQLLAISPTGNLVATTSGRHSQKKQLDFWTLDDGELKPVTSWAIAGFHDRNGFSPSSALFLDDSRFLTIGRRVVMWDRETAAPMYSFAIDGVAAFSANRKQIAVVNNEQIWIVDAQTGEALGKIDGNYNDIGGLAFSARGTYLAGFSKLSGEIRVWDLANGKMILQAATPGGSASSIDWAGDKYLLMNQAYLMDLEFRACVWIYNKSRGSIASSGDDRFWFVDGEKLTPIRLPHKNIAAKTENLDPDELLMLHPGARISLQFNLPFSPNERRQVESSIQEALESQGFVIDDHAEIELSAFIKKHDSETVEMSEFHDPFGRRGGTQTVTYTPKTCMLTLTKNGEIFWQKSQRNDVVGMLTLQENETAQKAATRACMPKPHFYIHAKFPAYAASLPSDQPPGKSTISAAGVK